MCVTFVPGGFNGRFGGLPWRTAPGGARRIPGGVVAPSHMGSMLHTLSPTELRDICFSTMQSNIIFSSQ